VNQVVETLGELLVESFGLNQAVETLGELFVESFGLSQAVVRSAKSDSTNQRSNENRLIGKRAEQEWKTTLKYSSTISSSRSFFEDGCLLFQLMSLNDLIHKIVLLFAIKKWMSVNLS